MDDIEVSHHEKTVPGKILAIDTSTRTGSIAVYSSLSGESAELSVTVKKTHAERLMSSINFLLEQTGFKIDDIDLIAVASGPGSFTGLRIGLATAKGLAFPSGIPLKAVSTLDALAERITDRGIIICPILDARRSEVYSALFKREKSGSMVKVGKEKVSSIDEVCMSIEGEAFFLGDGADTYEKKITSLMGERALFAPSCIRYPSALTLAHLALRKIAEGEGSDNVLTVKPIYIRKSDAEMKHG